MPYHSHLAAIPCPNTLLDHWGGIWWTPTIGDFSCPPLRRPVSGLGKLCPPRYNELRTSVIFLNHCVTKYRESTLGKQNQCPTICQVAPTSPWSTPLCPNVFLPCRIRCPMMSTRAVHKRSRLDLFLPCDDQMTWASPRPRAAVLFCHPADLSSSDQILIGSEQIYIKIHPREGITRADHLQK